MKKQIKWFLQVIIWLVIFVVGSLIVNFIIYPNTFIQFQNNIVNSFSKMDINSNDVNLSKYTRVDNAYLPSCKEIEIESQREGLKINDVREIYCEQMCKYSNLPSGQKYVENRCESGQLVCYCE